MSFTLENVPAFIVKHQPRTARAFVVVDFGEPDGGVRIKDDQHKHIIDTIARYVKRETGKLCSVRYDNYAGPIYWAELLTDED